MSVSLVNLTGAKLRIIGRNGAVTLDRDGPPPRVVEVRTDSINVDGIVIPLRASRIEGLPGQRHGVLVIVPREIRLAASHRPDLAYPDQSAWRGEIHTRGLCR